ncbi:hypothetical protein DIR46_16570 [Massilia oculi]|uniref:Uncharacterized protein n=1 Tax=Massilia oculi TaxID=945844 RepID=A0A2S2DKP8_9BURK|nr:hypothetical protein DIR46_16570 [Massilia oculi]
MRIEVGPRTLTLEISVFVASKRDLGNFGHRLFVEQAEQSPRQSIGNALEGVKRGFCYAWLNTCATAQDTRPCTQPLHGRGFHKEFMIVGANTMRVKR